MSQKTCLAFLVSTESSEEGLEEYEILFIPISLFLRDSQPGGSMIQVRAMLAAAIIPVLAVMPVLLSAQSQPGDSAIRSYALPEIEMLWHSQEYWSGYGTHKVVVAPELRYQYRNAGFSQLLAETTTAQLRSYGDGSLTTISLRGMESAHTSVWWNGIQVNSSLFGVTDLSLLHTATGGDIELEYGGASLATGTGGLAGALHLRTRLRYSRWGKDTTHFQPSVFLSGGSFGARTAGVSLTASHFRFFSQTQATLRRSENNYFFVNRAEPSRPVQQLENSAWNSFSVSQSIGFLMYNGMQLVAHAMYNNSYRELPSSMLSVNQQEEQRDSSLRVVAGIESYGNGLTKKELKIGYSNELMQYTHGLSGLQSQVRNSGLHSYGQYDVKAPLPFRRWHERLKLPLAFGYRFQHDMATSGGWEGNRFQTRISAYMQTSVRHRYTEINACVREEFADDSFSPLLFTAGGKHKIYLQKIHTALTFNANISGNYRIPTLNMLYWTPGGNPDLLPERSTSAEFGLVACALHTSVRGFVPEKDWNVGVSLFASDVNNWIQWTPVTAAIWSPLNVKEVFSRGMDARGAFSLPLFSALSIKMSAQYSYTLSSAVHSQVHPETEGLQLIYTPVHRGTASAEMVRKSAKKKGGESFLRYSHHFTGRVFTAADHSASLPGWSAGQIGAGHTFRVGAHSVSAAARIQNVWNISYETVAWRPMPGRTFFIDLTYQFH